MSPITVRTRSNTQFIPGRKLSLLLAAPLALLLVAFFPSPSPAQENRPKADSREPAQAGEEPGREGRLENERTEGPEFLRRRQDWFFEQRAFPIGFVPAGARLKALEQMRQMMQSSAISGYRFPATLRLPPLSGPTAPSWQAIGPQATNSPFNAPFTSGRISALAVDPTDANTVYLGAADGGLWKTNDGGANWAPLTDSQLVITSGSVNLGSIAVGSIAIDPSSCSPAPCKTIYVGTGEANFSGDNVYGEGVLKSIDSGVTWSHDNTFNTVTPISQRRQAPRIGALSVNPNSTKNNILLAGLATGTVTPSAGIYRSADGGLTWTQVGPMGGMVATAVFFDPNDAAGNTAYAGLTCGLSVDSTCSTASNGIYKSTNAGLTWTQLILTSLPVGKTTSNIGRIALTIGTGAGNKTHLYAAIGDGNATKDPLLGIFRSLDGGTTWSLLSGTLNFCNQQCSFDIVIAVSPVQNAGKDVVFAGGAASTMVGGDGATLIRSTDDGATWTDVSRASSGDGLHVDTHALAFNNAGTVLYVGNDGGVWKSSASLTVAVVGATFWANLNATLNVTQFYPGISIHPSTPSIGYGGTQDNGVQEYSGALIWNDSRLPCDGGWTVIDALAPSTIYSECQYLPNTMSFPIIARAFNGTNLGASGNLNSGINNADRGSFIPPLVGDPSLSQRVYFGTCRIWQSTDGANSWHAFSPDVTTPLHPATCPPPLQPTDPFGDLTTLTVAPSDSGTVYTGAGNGEIEVTPDGGQTWTSIRTLTLPNRSVTQIAVDPLNRNIAYVTFSGFATCPGCDTLGHVFRTANGTAGTGFTVWTDISGTGAGKLPDIPVNDIVVDPADPTRNTLFVATDIGVFGTFDGGLNWAVIGKPSSLAGSVVLSLKLHAPSRTLRAATHGRGMWDLALGGTPAFSITSISPTLASAGALSISNFTVLGSGFSAPTSKIKWVIGGTVDMITPTSAGPNQLVAAIPAADLQQGGVAQVSVVDGVQTSASLAFSILSSAPTLASISPTSAQAGGAPFTLTLTGTGFAANATVNFGGATKQVLTATQTQVTVSIAAADIAGAGTKSVTVTNPPPGQGGTSAAQNFVVNLAPGQDFTVTPQPPTSVTVNAGQSATYTIQVGGTGGFASAVGLTCSLPVNAAQTSCSFNPTPVTPSGATPINSTLTVTTTSRAFLPPPATGRRTGPRFVPLPLLVLATIALALLFLIAKTRRQRLVASVPLAAVLLLLVLQATGCGGGGSSAPPPPPPRGTQAGTYTVTITGTSVNLTHTSTVTLVVN